MTICSVRQRELKSLIGAAIASSRAECPFGQLDIDDGRGDHR
jgi:hypothetical protein